MSKPKLKVVTATSIAEARQAKYEAWRDENLPTLKAAYDSREIDAILHQAWKSGFFAGRAECTADWADHMERMTAVMRSKP